jgi:hypothetical protein
MGGGGSFVTGYQYFGGMAEGICMGPAKELYSITNGETVIWEGPVDVSSADGDGKTVLETTVGDVKFYWGLPTQNRDADLASLQIDFGTGLEDLNIPAMPGLVYFVGPRIAFGNQTVPPTLKFDLLVEPGDALANVEGKLVGDYDTTAAHVMAEILTNPIWGMQRIDNIDLTSFETVADKLVLDGMGLSFFMDDRKKLRSVLGALSKYGYAMPYYDNAQLTLHRIEYTADAGITITQADLLEEPKPDYQDWDELFGITRVKFTNRDNDHETDVVTFRNPAVEAATGQARSKDFDLPWVRSWDIASRLCWEKAVKMGSPQLILSLTLKPKWRGLKPGDIVNFTYSRGKLNLPTARYRVVKVRIPDSIKTRVEIEVVQIVQENRTKDYVMPDIAASGAQLDADGGSDWTPKSTQLRMLTLPPAKDIQNDGFVWLCERPDGVTTRMVGYYNYTTGWLPFRLIPLGLGDTKPKFPFYGHILSWHKMGDVNKWLLRVRIKNSWDRKSFEGILNNSDQPILLVSAKRKYKAVGTPINEHQISGLWASHNYGDYYTKLEEDLYEIEMEGEALGSENFALETLTEEGRYPCVRQYMGTEGGIPFCPKYNHTFKRNTAMSRLDYYLLRYYKVCTGNAKKIQAETDVDAVLFHKLDFDMCPDGTFYDEMQWGDRAITTYEIYDIEAGWRIDVPSAPDRLRYLQFEDVDYALGALYDEIASTAQTEKMDHIDVLLGAMIDLNLTHYNETN